MTRLKDRTLKNHYDRQNLREGNASVLLEALDMQKLQAASQAIARLEQLVPDEANMLNMALKSAKNELDAYVKGGVKQFFKSIVSDPVAKATSLASALETGLKQLPQVLKMYLPKGFEQEGQKSCLEMITDPAEQEKLISTMVKAFAPVGTGSVAGDLKSLFSDNSMPYVLNLKAAVKELLQNVAPTGAFKLGQQAASVPPVPPVSAATADPAGAAAPGAPTATGAPAAAGQASPTPTPGQASPSGATKAGIAPTPSKVSTTAGQTQATAPAQAAQASNAAPLDPVKDAEKINNIAYFIASQTGVDKDAAAKIMQALAKAKGLKDIPVPAKPSPKLASAAPSAAAPTAAPAK